MDKLQESAEYNPEDNTYNFELYNEELGEIRRNSEAIWEIDVTELEEAAGYALKEISDRYLID